MVNTSKYTAWCCGCGQIWEEDNATDRDTKYNNHDKDCSLVKEMNAYFSANADKAHEIKMLLTWFNSFKTLKEHLKNDDDISKINRTGFYHDDSGWQNEYKDWFVELRGREGGGGPLPKPNDPPPNDPSPTKTKIKLTGCQCSEKDKEFEVDLKGNNYDPDKDLITCPNCQNLDKYKNFQKELNLDGEEVSNKGHKLSVAIIYGVKEKPTMSKLKLTGCRCEYRPAELGGEGRIFEVDLQGETYDPNKDLVACPQCQRQDKYNQFTKKNFNSNEVGKPNHQLPITIIYGAKIKDKPTTEKCADCQQEKKAEELTTIQNNNKDIKVCSDCKTKRDDKDKPNSENEKKWGSDFGQLKPGQRQGRIKTQNSWSQGKAISFVCLHCQKSFPMDKSIENYLEARQKAQNELNTHKNSCSLKNSEEAKRKLQEWWEKKRKSKARIIKTCEKCWGKVLWDKSIKDVEQARKQALSDLKYHQDKECGTESKKKIAIYHSPNSGGNEHAPIVNSLTDDGIYNEDNEGEVYQEKSPNKDKGTWTPWIIGGVIFLVLIIGYIFYRKFFKK